MSWIIKAFKWLWGLWNKIPDEIKEAIIDIIVKGFEALLRAFYKEHKEKEKKEE